MTVKRINKEILCSEDAKTPDVITEECKECEYFVEEETTMKTNTQNTNANATVNETKEVNTMTNATLNMQEYMAQVRADLEKANGISMNRGAEATKGFACRENVGLTPLKILSAEMVTLKKKGNEDKGTAPSFQRALKIEAEGVAKPILMRQTVMLYRDDKRVENIDIYDEITDGSGNIGMYFTVTEDALKHKKASELTPADLVPHELAENEHIFNPLRINEFKALRKQLDIAELVFDKNEKADIPQVTVNMYVYEDVVVADSVLKEVDGVMKKFAKTKYYYNASFVAPEDVANMKYGRRFTNSKNSAHRKELEQLPGVVRYLESC